jgi:hypothetical protein
LDLVFEKEGNGGGMNDLVSGGGFATVTVMVLMGKMKLRLCPCCS